MAKRLQKETGIITWFGSKPRSSWGRKSDYTRVRDSWCCRWCSITSWIRSQGREWEWSSKSSKKAQLDQKLFPYQLESEITKEINDWARRVLVEARG